jgi:hypothetical protein
MGESCQDGMCRPDSVSLLVGGLMQPEDIATDGVEVFFSTLGDGGIYKVKATGGSAVPIAGGQAKPVRLALDATHVYWANELGGAVMRAARDGSSPVEAVAAAARPIALVLDAANVYWIERPAPGMVALKRAPKAAGGSGVTLLDSGTGGPSYAFDLQISGDLLYVIAEGVWTYPLASGIKNDVPPNFANLGAFAVDENHYFASGGTSASGAHYSWSSRTGDKEGGDGLEGPTGPLVATPCGAVSGGASVDFVPLLPPLLLDGIHLIVPTMRVASGPARRLAYVGRYVYWTNPGKGTADGGVYRARTPM